MRNVRIFAQSFSHQSSESLRERGDFRSGEMIETTEAFIAREQQCGISRMYLEGNFLLRLIRGA